MKRSPPSTPARFYWVQQVRPATTHDRPRPPLALSLAEEQRVLNALNSERFIDRSPYQIYAALLDEGHYLGSIHTLYRVLERHSAVRERRNPSIIRCTPNPNCWRPPPIKFGLGTSPGLRGCRKNP